MLQAFISYVAILCYECILRVLKSSKTNITENNDENNTEV